MTEQNFQDEEERQQYAAWRAGCQDPEAAARGAWIAAKHGWTIAHSLQADFARAKRFEAAYLVWQEKTEWVQQTSKAQELGKHRADVLRERIEAMERENAGLREQMAAIGAGGVEPLRKRECLQQSATVTPEKIRDVFLAHGFTIKPGMDDLKPYVYEAALALLALQTAPPAPAAVAVPDSHTQALKAIAEWPVTDMLLNMDAANMRGIAQRALAATQPAAQGLEADLTDEQIDEAFNQMPDGAYGFLKSWGYRQFARAVLAAQAKQGEQP